MTDINALVERLRTTPTHRTWDSVGRHYDYPENLPHEAAEALTAQAQEIAKLREALEFIAEEHDAGRHDGKPEACPAHDGESMWLCAIATLEQKEPSHD